LDVGWTAILAFMPVVAIVQVLPLTIGGLGLREGAFILFPWSPRREHQPGGSRSACSCTSSTWP